MACRPCPTSDAGRLDWVGSAQIWFAAMGGDRYYNRRRAPGGFVSEAPRSAPEPVDIAVGVRVRLRRQTLNVSQTALAQAVGLTFRQVQKYERGANRVSASMLVKIAARLDTTVAALIGEDDGLASAVDARTRAQLAVLGAPQLLAAFSKIADGSVRRALRLVADRMVEATQSQQEAEESGKRLARGALRP